jgi:putative SOS response-associated peptidase YedK
MCGRASLATPPEDLAALFALDEVPAIEPRFNMAPGQPLVIVRRIPGDPGARRAELALWGLRGGRDARPILLVRVESAFARFHKAARSRRCLVLVDGFYEWRGERRRRQPFHFRRRDGAPFALAAVWDPAESGLACAILTTAARPPVLEVHDRMPIPIAPSSRDAWLDPSLSTEAARALAVVDPDAHLVASAVSTYVNDANHEGPACLALAEQAGLF